MAHNDLGRVTMTERRGGSLFVTLTADTAAFRDAVDAAARKMTALLARLNGDPVWRHYTAHHLPEDPATSTMHAAYDRRRRARRRRNRR